MSIELVKYENSTEIYLYDTKEEYEFHDNYMGRRGYDPVKEISIGSKLQVEYECAMDKGLGHIEKQMYGGATKEVLIKMISRWQEEHVKVSNEFYNYKNRVKNIVRFVEKELKAYASSSPTIWRFRKITLGQAIAYSRIKVELENEELIGERK